jgi:hypothetical protein
MTTQQQITAMLGNAPVDLVSYFDAGHFRQRPHSRVCCLPLTKALEYTSSVLSLTIGDHFGLFVLHDGNDSNPHCYVSSGPCSGSVFHLMHDGDCRISHQSLDSFLTALDALPEDESIDDLKEDRDILFDTIPTIEGLLSRDEAIDILLPVYLPVTKSIPVDLKRQLAASPDFYVREAMATWLSLRGAREDLSLAETLASDSYGQVSRPAKVAISKLRAR